MTTSKIIKKPKVVHDSWASFFDVMMNHPEWQHLENMIKSKKHVICPQVQNIFRVFSMPLDKIKTVFVGLSPYQNKLRNELFATGLAFAVPNRNMDTPSLKVIRDELELTFPHRDVDDSNTFDYTLEHWHNQGVFLYNIALSVILRADARIHLGHWAWFTMNLMKFLNKKLPGNPFVFMGKDAQKYNVFIEGNHEVINVYHPAAEARNPSGPYKFTNKNVFNRVNEYLISMYNEEINWLL